MKAGTKQQFLKIINSVIKANQLDGVILGCTELPLLLSQNDFANVKVFDIAKIQIAACVDKMIGPKM